MKFFTVLFVFLAVVAINASVIRDKRYTDAEIASFPILGSAEANQKIAEMEEQVRQHNLKAKMEADQIRLKAEKAILDARLSIEAAKSNTNRVAPFVPNFGSASAQKKFNDSL